MARIVPQQGEYLTIWIVYSSCATGTHIEGAFTHKVQAEAHMRWCVKVDRNNSSFWVRELDTAPHNNHC